MTATNNFTSIPQIPHKIFQFLAENQTEYGNNFWKALVYNDLECLTKPDLSLKERIAYIWSGQSDEENYKLFNKPLVSNSLPDANSMNHLRLFRIRTEPTTSIQATISFEMDIYTNDTDNSLYDSDGYIVERTDYLESIILQILNNADFGVGYTNLRFDREISRGSHSALSLGNNKSMYGRQIIFSMQHMQPNIVEGQCYE